MHRTGPLHGLRRMGCRRPVGHVQAMLECSRCPRFARRLSGSVPVAELQCCLAPACRCTRACDQSTCLEATTRREQRSMTTDCLSRPPWIQMQMMSVIRVWSGASTSDWRSSLSCATITGVPPYRPGRRRSPFQDALPARLASHASTLGEYRTNGVARSSVSGISRISVIHAGSRFGRRIPAFASLPDLRSASATRTETARPPSRRVETTRTGYLRAAIRCTASCSKASLS